MDDFFGRPKRFENVSCHITEYVRIHFYACTPPQWTWQIPYTIYWITFDFPRYGPSPTPLPFSHSVADTSIARWSSPSPRLLQDGFHFTHVHIRIHDLFSDEQGIDPRFLFVLLHATRTAHDQTLHSELAPCGEYGPGQVLVYRPRVHGSP